MPVDHPQDRVAGGLPKPFSLPSVADVLLGGGRLRALAVAAPVIVWVWLAIVGGISAPLLAQTINAGVDVTSTIATMPEYGMGIHTSVYDNSLRYEGSYVYNQLDGRLDDAGIDVLRYPGGGYADVFHFSLSRQGLTGYGLSPRWGVEGNYNYMGYKTDFGNFIKLLDATNSKTIITVNTGSAMKYNNPSLLGVPTHPGQPQEAAAWVAYANGDPSIFGTPSDIDLGVDAEGNDWKTAGYWARLRASTLSEYAAWSSAAGLYNGNNNFLAINHDEPAGIEYWEIGNECFGTGYYGGVARNPAKDINDDTSYTGYAQNYAYPYNGLARDDRPELSPAAYGEQVNAFQAAMRAVDPTIKIGAVLATPPGDYSWCYADLDDDGVKDTNEPYWNDEVLSHTDAGLGKVADNVDFVIAHWYPSGSQTDPSVILNLPRTTIPRMINGTTSGQDTGSNAGLRDSIATWRTDGDGSALEIFITETDGAGYEETADGLFAADEYITFFENGVSNVDYLELHNGQFLQESTNEPNFAYWGIQSVHLLAPDIGDELVSTSTTESDVRIHAAVQADGSVAVMILNMNTGSRTVNVSINGDTLFNRGVMYETDGDTALAMTDLDTLGNSFSTSIPGRTLQLFVIPLPPLAGDYNDDGIVDAADYTVWRDNYPGGTLINETVSFGVVDEADYQEWKAHFGETSSPGSGSGAAAVPEPASAVMFAMIALALLTRRVGGPSGEAA
jgi:hypothetical protein